MPVKKEIFKGDPDTTYVVNHPSEGEVIFKTDNEGKYTPKNEKEADAIRRVYGLKGS